MPCQLVVDQEVDAVLIGDRLEGRKLAARGNDLSAAIVSSPTAPVWGSLCRAVAPIPECLPWPKQNASVAPQVKGNVTHSL